MKTAYLLRWGAYGDHVHMTNVIRALDEDGWHITLEHNLKGKQVHLVNPRVEVTILNDPMLPDYRIIPHKHGRHLFNLQAKYDKVVSFQNSLEEEIIENEIHPRYFWPLKWRRRKNARICYYDQAVKWAGLTDSKYMGMSGEVWFKEKEHQTVVANLDKKRDTFMIMYAWQGTMQQKATYHGIGEVFKRWLEFMPSTTIFTTGDERCRDHEQSAPIFRDERFIHLSGRVPYRQAMAISRYMDLVITPETGLGIAAGAMEVPKIMLLTAASVKNIVGNDKHDFSLQSPAFCSPCTRAIYNVDNCPVKDGHPICVYFDPDMVFARMVEVVNAGIVRDWEPRDSDVRTMPDGTKVWR